MNKIDFDKKLSIIDAKQPEELSGNDAMELENDLDCKEIGICWSDWKAENEKSGKINLRIPKTLHYEISELAKQEETSVNQFILWAISEAVGMCKGSPNQRDRFAP